MEMGKHNFFVFFEVAVTNNSFLSVRVNLYELCHGSLFQNNGYRQFCIANTCNSATRMAIF